jgi:hypothetical protein
MNQYNWFSVKHILTNKVMSSCDMLQGGISIESPVIVTKPQHNDNELWRWAGQQLENKSTGLVLDIHEGLYFPSWCEIRSDRFLIGKLRAIEDTEICLCYKKPPEDAHSQMWGIQTSNTSDLFTRRFSQVDSIGKTIYSISNSDWVLDVCPNSQKVILFPQDPLESSLQQKWEFIPENVTTPSECNLFNEPGLLFENQAVDPLAIDDYYIFPRSRNSSVSSTSESIGFAHGLTPARRNSSRSSISSHRKDSLLGDEFSRYHEFVHFH